MPLRTSASPRRPFATTRLSVLALEGRITPVRFRAPSAEAAAPVATPAEMWQRLDSMPVALPGQTSYLALDRFLPLRLDANAIDAVLDAAPAEAPGWNESSPQILTLPAPDGSTARFRIVNFAMMEPALAAQFPEIRTFRGQGIDDPAATLAADFTPQGFHAQVLSPNGSWYIDPYYHLDQSVYASYYRSDANPAMSATVTNFRELPPVEVTQDHDHDDHDGGELPTANRSGTMLRTYRLACAATGEYTAFHGGTVTLGQAAVVTANNRVSGLWEVECAIRLTLVGNNSTIIYTNAGTDPYSNNDGATMLSQNQTTCDTLIGNLNYDIGHVFSTGGGGIAGLGVVGITGNKARGVTGSPQPIGDNFWVDYVIHEQGHQFRGNHTFNANIGGRASSAAMEPGSGSTIMGYAGITGADDLQLHSDPYFHSISFDEIISFVDGSIPGVGTRTATGNQVPVINALTNFAIPALTPFALTGSATDGNGDTLSYNWESRALGPAQSLAQMNATDNGQSPIFRSFNGSINPTRTFPRLSNLITNTVPVGERYPATARASYPFRVTVRDNRAGGGGVNTRDMSLQIVATGSAFAVTAPNTNVTWAGGSTQTVTWNVAGTTNAPINAANVNIRLSTDSGNTFPTVLAANVPNDGSETVQMPFNLGTTTARIKVEPTNNVFFDFSNANFTITNVPPSNPPRITGVEVNAGQSNLTQQSRVTSVDVTFNAVVTLPADPATAFTLTRTSFPLPGGGTGPVQFTATASNATGVTVVTLSNFTGANADFGSLADGLYSLGATASLITANGQQLDGDGNGTGGDDYSLAGSQANGLYRLFGDITGEGVVNAADLGQFAPAFGTVLGDSNYRDFLDFDASTAINAFDYGQFRIRFGINLFP